jgi:arylsulfatase A-like enzyme
MKMKRRDFLKSMSLGAAVLATPGVLQARGTDSKSKPNIILCMTDDQGWGDTGYNGRKELKTPALDAMAGEGLRFDRWYSGAPVCSPTRGSCITGRHPYRYGIFFANTGHMKPEEITLAEALKTQGYATGHFGKWHLGTLTRKTKDANRGGPQGVKNYSPPWKNGFDVCFATESKVPTWDPMKKPGGDAPYGTYYWDGPEHRVTENLEGDDSRVIMDRAIPFIQGAAKAGKPFLAVIWFHTPHLPVVAGGKYREMYKDSKGVDYFGCITAMDDQVARLRAELKKLRAADHTMLWFSSDNGPEGRKFNGFNGSAGPLRGRKRSLYEGGVRVPGLLVWPGKISKPRVVKMPCSTSDYFPTVMEAIGFKMKGQVTPVDGVSLMPLIEGKMTQRPRPIGFQSSGKMALIDNRYKIYGSSGGGGKRRKKGKKPGASKPETASPGARFELYDLIEDPGEAKNIAAEHPDIVKTMSAQLLKWAASCKASNAGEDYK